MSDVFCCKDNIYFPYSERVSRFFINLCTTKNNQITILSTNDRAR
jgi:hypothetical protein